MNSRRPYLTTNLVGGLGNQLFLFANLVATSIRHQNMPIAVPHEKWSSSNEAPRPTYWNSLFRNLVQQMKIEDRNPLTAAPGSTIVTVTENRPDHNKIVLDSQRAVDCYNLVGFFQSEKYFSDAKESVLTLFSPEDLCAAATSRLQASYIEHDDQHLVAMHVRRGDYLRMQDVFHVLGHSYYISALQQLFGRLLLSETSRFFAAGGTSGAVPPKRTIRVLLFSEDQRYAQTLAGVIESKFGGVSCAVVGTAQEQGYAEGHTEAEMPREVLEMLMIAGCHDVVAANSSYSWWGAYLNQQPGRRVVAPALWFKNEPFPEASRLYPADWLLV